MRLIDADALKEEMDMEWCPDMAVSEIWNVIDRAPTIGGWISVKDRMPEPNTNDEVLTTYVYDDKPGKYYVETATYWDDGEGTVQWDSVWDEYRVGNARKTVIAWMPMPKPYKPPKEEDE